jgi:phospholipid/cholesterol/gamma-HCH transport system permease protein
MNAELENDGVISADVPASSGKALAIRFFEWFGELSKFTGRVLRFGLTPPYEFRELVKQMDEIGAKSLPLVALAGAAIGIVLSMQTSASLTRFGAKAMLPVVIVLSIVRESGPIITALIVCGRVGAGIGAELGSMKVTEQIDAMEVSAVNVYRLLAGTRVLACILMLPLLTIIADFAGILMGWVGNLVVDPISFHLFVNRGFSRLTFSDMLPATFRTAVFGLIIGLVSSFQGMKTEGGTEGVGSSAKSSVVLSSLFIILADVLLVRITLTLFG